MSETPQATEAPKTNINPEADQLRNELSSLKHSIAEKELKLLEPEYLEFLDAKKRPKAVPVTSSPNSDVAALQAQISELTSLVQGLQTHVSNTEATTELKETKSKFSDWSDYEPDIINYFSKNPNTTNTYAEVYYLVKSTKEAKEAPKDNQPAKKVPTAYEKPGSSVPASEFKPKEYKNVEESNAATIASLREKYPSLGDTI